MRGSTDLVRGRLVLPARHTPRYHGASHRPATRPEARPPLTTPRSITRSATPSSVHGASPSSPERCPAARRRDAPGGGGGASGRPGARRLRDQPRDEAGSPYRIAPLEIGDAAGGEAGPDAGADGSTSPIEAAEVAPPGFLDLRLRPAAYAAIVDDILARPEAWGRVEAIRPRTVNVEFVSANPTRPLTMGNAARVPSGPPEPGPRGRRPAGHARVLLQRRRRPMDNSGVGRRTAPRGAGSRGRLPRRPTWSISRRACPTTCGPTRRSGRRQRGGPRDMGRPAVRG